MKNLLIHYWNVLANFSPEWEKTYFAVKVQKRQEIRQCSKIYVEEQNISKLTKLEQYFSRTLINKRAIFWLMWKQIFGISHDKDRNRT